MATTQNTYTGNGSTILFSFTFPYLDESDIKVSVNGTLTTAYTLATATTIQFTTAPANGASVRIYRETNDTETKSTFFPGSAVRAQDLNENFTQSLYVTQESKNTANSASSNATTALANSQAAQASAATAVSTANTAAANASTAISTADGAVTTANAAAATASSASSTANTAITTANAASSAATSATNTANNASTSASTALSTANTASTNASQAVTTANSANATAATASSNASAAVNTANSASNTANTAASTATSAASSAATAVTTANTALSNSNTAVSTANQAATNASAAVSTANTASTGSTAAQSTANSALATANSALATANDALSDSALALTTANTATDEAADATAFATAANSNALEAVAIANSATAAVANAILYDTVANTAAIPTSPSNNDAVEIVDSTGIESFTPLTGLPAGFVGLSALSVRLVYSNASSAWIWIQYYPNDPETRYLAKTGGLMTGQIFGDSSTSLSTPAYAFDGDGNTGIGRTGTDELALVTGGVARLTADAAGNINVSGGLSKNGTDVVITTDARLADMRTPTDGSVTNVKVAVGAAIDKAKISGTAITAADTGTITSAMIADGTIVNADISTTAAIDNSKLATSGVAAGTYGSSSLIPSFTVNDKGLITSATTNSLPAGIVTTSDTGTITSTMIANGTIVDADISTVATIDGTKISPNFGAQNVITTGSATASSFNGSGASLTGLNASNLGSGTIPDARFPATLPAVSGVNLTGIAPFPAGTTMLFVQTNAPTGWTKSTTHNNKALRVVSGTATSGGTTAFTSVFTSRTPSGSVSGTNSGGVVSDTTLTQTQMPSHFHTTTLTIAQSGSATANFGGTNNTSPAANNRNTDSKGSGGAHGHGFTNPSWSGSFTGTAMDFAVQYVDVIIATKD